MNLIVQEVERTENAPRPRSRYWSKTMIHYLLRNRVYLGERIYNRRSYKAYRRGEKANLANPRDAWVVKENAHAPIIDRDLFDRVQAVRKAKVITIGRTFHRPYLLTGIARCANCGYRMIGQPSNGNGHKYLTYTCSGYLRIGKSVCRSVHVLTELLEQEVLQSIQAHLSSPTWKDEVRETLDLMASRKNSVTTAQSRVEEIQRQLGEVNRQIANIVEAIKTSGRLSEAMNRTFADLEAQRDSARAALAEVEKRANKRMGAATLGRKNRMANAGEFDRIWNEGLAVEERKELLRCCNVHQSQHHAFGHQRPSRNLAIQDSNPAQKNDPRDRGLESTHL